MPNLAQVQQTKEKILSTIRLKGPSFPARIARDTSLSPLFTGAFLSELVAERKLKLSNMKVGSSPLYFIEGQEPLLENFTEYLNPKEKEAFLRLKNERLLSDEEQEPALRVALRKLKDFAFPLNVRTNGETKLFWKFFQLPDSEAKNLLQSFLSPQPTPLPTPVEEKVKEIVKEKIEEKQEIEEIKIKKKPKKNPDSSFSDQVKDHLNSKEIELLSLVESKKKEFFAKVSIDTIVGKQEFYLIAKDKKKITPDDLSIAIQKAQSEKMPALLLAPGELDKNAKEYIKEWRNMIKFDSLKQ